MSSAEKTPVSLADLPPCPVETTLTLISDKWKVLILRDLLLHGTMRFGELKKSIGHVTQKVLTAQLRQMEESRISKRRGAVHLCSTPSFICVHLPPAHRAAPNRGASGWRQPPHPGGSRRNSGSIEFVPIEILRTVDFGNLL